MTKIVDILVRHQRVGLGLTGSSPDRCSCESVVYPVPASDDPQEDILYRRNVAFAMHQANAVFIALTERGVADEIADEICLDAGAIDADERIPEIRDQAAGRIMNLFQVY